MATLYNKRNKWYIEYVLGGIRKTKNTKLEATKENFAKANELKIKIEELIDSQNESIKNIINGNVTLKNAIKEYRNIYIIGRSESHIENFDYVLRRFLKIVSPTIAVKNIKVENVTQFVIDMKKELSPATQYTYFQYLASFLIYLKEKNYIDEIPIGKGIRPKKAVKNIISFDPVDLEMILNEAKSHNIIFYHTYKLLLLTGQRPGDVLGLQIRDIDFHRKIVYFRVSKTSSEFKFPIYSKLEQFLIEDLGINQKSNRDEYLFPNLTVNALGKDFRKIKKKLGYNKKQYYTLKTFRKNFATNMSRMGMTIQEVQALLDHKSPSTTLRYYADVRADELRNKIDNLQNKFTDKPLTNH